MENVEVNLLLAQFKERHMLTNDAFVRLGQEELGAGVAPANLLRVGKRAFDNAFKSISGEICGSEVIKKAVTNRNAIDSGTIAALVSSASGAATWSNVNIALVSYIAARVGIRMLCAPIWKDGNA